MNQTEVDRLAAMASQLRPDWPVASLRTQLAGHAHRPYRDVAVALAWVACDPQTRTPARLAENGPWWAATLAGRPELTPTPPKLKPDDVVPATPEALRRHAETARELVRAARPVKHAGLPDTACNPPPEDTT